MTRSCKDRIRLNVMSYRHLQEVFGEVSPLYYNITSQIELQPQNAIFFRPGANFLPGGDHAPGGSDSRKLNVNVYKFQKSVDKVPIL